MKVLVTGGAGYIGSHTVRMLLESGHEVCIIDNLSNGHSECVPEGVRFFNIDLCRMPELSEVFQKNRFDAVMHFASFIEVGISMKDPLIFYRNNLISTINLLEAMKISDVKKIVFSSSAAVYGIPGEKPISEDEKLHPINVYGRIKLIVERMLEDYDRAYGLKSVSLRYFNAAGAAYGIGEDHRPESHLIPLVLQVALGKRDNFSIYGDDYATKDGTCIRDYIHVLDLAKAHILALDNLRESQVYNLGNGQGFSVKEVIEVAKAVTRKDINVKVAERRLGDAPMLVADASRAKKILGWTPKLGLQDIIESAWEWHSRNPEGFKR